MLEVDRLGAGYGAAPALWEVSLAIAERELVCVLGPNGAGKTTLINAIAGLLPARGGRIVMDGRELTRAAPHRFCASGIAIVPEGRRLFAGMTVRENLEIGSYLPQARRERARSLDYVCALFPAVREKLDHAAGSLSGGQQQMVAIGRALMARPRLLLLDEPSLGLSPAIVLAMFDAIREVNAAGTAVLLVEQNVAMALDLAGRAYLLEEGRVVAEGPPAALFDRPELKRAYLGHDPVR
ncbi:High-affinity branched-chain amino acid transport ATP-binding protein LivF [Burkholderiales bacterium]|nr:High-affinity branched-chain amino acid transport ATP-binding protein LivF [Burkholderiales bacterium]